ncbi:unnamed protein product [Vitrella brassicaformis CCMP3155]|uniref:Uncharacterized protein n=2 Tax=Vitrella brassicaformis TaxID=1169539 RepID=A0A0G4ERT4_VITBC|nr:unnamed protein product [Vitrella brassicaformis CCMP3155]|eukprot:CEM00570.1 unnamed protein product [Vitrella brassicaformis CCMP3155]
MSGDDLSTASPPRHPPLRGDPVTPFADVQASVVLPVVGQKLHVERILQDDFPTCRNVLLQGEVLRLAVVLRPPASFHDKATQHRWIERYKALDISIDVTVTQQHDVRRSVLAPRYIDSGTRSCIPEGDTPHRTFTHFMPIATAAAGGGGGSGSGTHHEAPSPREAKPVDDHPLREDWTPHGRGVGVGEAARVEDMRIAHVITTPLAILEECLDREDLTLEVNLTLARQQPAVNPATTRRLRQRLKVPLAERQGGLHWSSALSFDGGIPPTSVEEALSPAATLSSMGSSGAGGGDHDSRAPILSDIMQLFRHTEKAGRESSLRASLSQLPSTYRLSYPIELRRPLTMGHEWAHDRHGMYLAVRVANRTGSVPLTVTDVMTTMTDATNEVYDLPKRLSPEEETSCVFRLPREDPLSPTQPTTPTTIAVKWVYGGYSVSGDEQTYGVWSSVSVERPRRPDTPLHVDVDGPPECAPFSCFVLEVTVCNRRPSSDADVTVTLEEGDGSGGQGEWGWTGPPLVVVQAKQTLGRIGPRSCGSVQFSVQTTRMGVFELPRCQVECKLTQTVVDVPTGTIRVKT